MGKIYDRVAACAACVRRVTDFVPEVALVLGSGLGNYAENIQVEATVDYNDIEGFPVSTVPGHQGRFILGTVRNVPVIAMQGRVHFYEGYGMEDVVLPVRLMKMLGARTLILTNAAGGVNYDFVPGDLMMITDHISTMIPSPLTGQNDERMGARFPDMSQVYDAGLQEKLRQCAAKLDIRLQEGIYIQLTGPQYETPAEIRMIRNLGADAVGMSTVCEAVAACHMGMKICGISCITNLASGMSDRRLNHEEVQETADRVAGQFERLVTELIGSIG